MPPRTAKRTVAALGVLTLLAITIGLALSWQEIQVKYHLYRLQNEPDYLKQVVSAPEKSIRRSAMIEYLGTVSGKERLFDLYLEIHEHSISRLAGLERHRAGGNGVLWDPTRKFVAAFHNEGFDLVMPESEGGTDTESHVLMDSLLPYPNNEN